MKTVLITGANGSLAQAVIKRLKGNSNYHVVATSRSCRDTFDLQLDVRDPKQIADAIKCIDPDLVLHLAATFTNDFNEAYAINVEAARHLLEAAQQSESRLRILLVGSAAEYGVVRPEENPIREDRILRPVSMYGLTKAWQTQLAGLYASRGVDTVVARIFNLDGPGLSERLFIGRLKKQIDDVLAGQRSVIELGSLSAIRDYVSIGEAADQMIAIAAQAESGRIYHVASGIPVTMRQVLARYLAIHKLDVSIVKEAAELSNRTGYDAPSIYANIENTMQLLKVWRTCVKT